MEKNKHSEETFYIYILNVLACIAVISMHHNGKVYAFSNTLGWKQALGVEVLAYWAVPVFYMISGATLMNYRERYSTETFLKKRFLKSRSSLCCLERTVHNKEHSPWWIHIEIT